MRPREILEVVSAVNGWYSCLMNSMASDLVLLPTDSLLLPSLSPPSPSDNYLQLSFSPHLPSWLLPLATPPLVPPLTDQVIDLLLPLFHLLWFLHFLHCDCFLRADCHRIVDSLIENFLETKLHSKCDCFLGVVLHFLRNYYWDFLSQLDFPTIPLQQVILSFAKLPLFMFSIYSSHLEVGRYEYHPLLSPHALLVLLVASASFNKARFY